MELNRTTSQVHAVCIVGVGAVTSVGTDAAMTAASVRAGLTRFRESPLIDKAGAPMLWAMAPFLEYRLQGLNRIAALAVPALREAVAPLQQKMDAQLPALPIMLGLPMPRPGWDPAIERSVLHRLEADTGLRFAQQERYGLPFGHAAGMMAMEQGVQLIAARQAEWVLVGGVDSYRAAETLEWLDEIGRLHSDVNPDGFIPSEGAGFCLLASETTTRRYGLVPLATILTAVSAEEPFPSTSDGICIGAGLTAALRRALTSLAEGERADWTLCDMNGESFRGTEWIYAYLRTGPKHGDPLELWHPVDCYGDIGAASGPVLAVLAVQAGRRHYARGQRCLIWTSSDGPQRSATLLAVGEASGGEA